MFKISKEFHFSASHQLHGLYEGHPCQRLHGHNYIIRVTLASETVNEVGFVQDYGELKPIGKWIDETLDHRHLNDVLGELLPNGQTSAENMARYIYQRFKPEFPTLESVSLSETPKTWATYSE